MSSIARQPTRPGAPPPWSPTPTAVIVGAVWVLLGAGAYLVASQPVVVVVAAAALLATSVAGARSTHADGRGRRTGRTIDLDARLEREAGRR